jgi:chromosome segregation ATPase
MNALHRSWNSIHCADIRLALSRTRRKPKMHKKSLITLATMLTLLISADAFSAQQVEIQLRSGQKVTGELISEDASHVVIKTTTIGKTGRAMSMTGDYKRGEILELTHLADLEQTYANRAATSKTADEHSALATWCREHAMLDQAVEQAKQALALNKDQTAAATLMTNLGWVQADGKWLKEVDLLASQGKVRYQGKVMTLEEAKAVKAQEKQQQGLKEAQQVIDDKTSALAKLDHQIDDLPKRPAQIETEIANDTAAMAVAQAATQRVTDAKAAASAADAAVQQAQATLPRTVDAAGKITVDTSSLIPLIHAAETAQKAYNDARRGLRSAEEEFGRLRDHLAKLQSEKKSLEKKAIDLKAKREALAKELEKAKADLAAMSAAPSITAPALKIPGEKPGK